MANNERNALAELEEQLDRVGIELCYEKLDNESETAVRKAKRIVAELAKTVMLNKANDQMTEAMRAFHDSNAFDFESALLGLKRTVRKLEQAATGWADEVEQSERIKRKKEDVSK